MPDQEGPPPLGRKAPEDSTEDLERAFLWFDGILEGPVGDRDLLRSTTTRLDAIGIVSCNLEIEGGRFSVLLDDKSKKMSRVSEQQRARLLELIQTIVDMSPEPMRVESTLRCTEIVGKEARETLFAVSDAMIQRVSRTRRANNDDLGRRPRTTTMIGAEFENSRWRKPAVAGIILLAALGLAIQSGILSRALSPPAEELVIERDPFDELLDISIEKKWGSYIVTIGRGEAFPLTMAEFEARAKAEKLLEKSAAIGAVSRGGPLYVGLLDKKGNAEFQKGVNLMPLITKPDGEITLVIPGTRNAMSVSLALAPFSVEK